MLEPKRSEPKAKGTSRASKPAAGARSPPKAGAKAKPGAEAERATAMATSHLIDERIRSLGGWRAETLAEVRRLIHEADPDIMEACKWIKPSKPTGGARMVPRWDRLHRRVQSSNADVLHYGCKTAALHAAC